MGDGSTEQVSRQELRARYAAEGARELRRSIDRHDLTQGEVADCVGTRYQRVSLWCDRHRREEPRFSEIAMLPRDVAVDLLRHLAAIHGATVVDRIESLLPGTVMKRMAAASKAVAETSLQVLSALEDDVLDDQERRAIKADAERAAHHLLALAAAMEPRVVVQ
jgi:hypothetical protein